MKRKLKAVGILGLIGVLVLSPCSAYAAPPEGDLDVESSMEVKEDSENQNSEQAEKSEDIVESEDKIEENDSDKENEREIKESEKSDAPAASGEADEESQASEQAALRSAKAAYQGKATDDSGNFANVVVFVEFADTEATKTTEGTKHINSAWGACYREDPKLTELFQGDDAGNYPRAMKKYLQNISYNQLEVANIFPQYDATANKIHPYTLKNNLDYYADKGVQGDDEIIDEISDILASSGQVPSGINLDRNGDKNVDNLMIIVPCEYGNTNVKYYGHQSKYRGGKDAKINNTSIGSFTLIPESGAYLSSSQSGVIVHEFLHTMGYSDLYILNNSNANTSPVGRWDIMANQNQWLQYPLAYFRSEYTNWFNIPTVTDSKKNYSIYAASAATKDVKDNQAVILKTDYSSSEFFVVEYRKKSDGYTGSPYDQMVYGSGIIIYRINTKVNNGNSYAPPYMTYIFRPGDTVNADGSEKADANLLEQSYFSAESGRTSFGNSDVNATLAENAITYSDGTNSGIVISNIGSANGDQISFDISFTGAEENLKWKLEAEDTTGLTMKEVNSWRGNDGATYYIAQTGAFSDKTSAVVKYKDGKWSKVADGPQGSDHKIVVHNNEIYTLYLDSTWHVRLDKLVGSSWKNLFVSGEVSTSGGTALNASDAGVCFAYMDEYVWDKGNKVYAYSYLDTDKTAKLDGTFSSSTAGFTYLSISLLNKDLLLEYRDSGKVYVRKFDRGSGAWVNLLDGTMQANAVLLKQNGDLLYLLKNGTTWGENKSYLYVYDMSVANSSWTQVGSNEVMDCTTSQIDLCFNGNVPYVVYNHSKDGIYSTYAMALKDGQWEQLGLKVSSQEQTGMSSYCDNGKIYVTYLDSTSKKVHIRSLPLNEETEKEIPIASVVLDKKNCTLKIGESAALSATIQPENTTADKSLTWSSSNRTVAEVDTEGKITAKKVGTADITVKTSNGKTAVCKVTVEKDPPINPTVPIQSVALNETKCTLKVGTSKTLSATIVPENTTDAKTLTWSSSNGTVAAVDTKGKITAKKAGTTDITVKTSNGKTATCKVTVKQEGKISGWQKDSRGYWYRNPDGSYPRSQWKYIDNKWYYFDNSGYRVTGWKLLGSKWYYMNGNGVMLTGWQRIGSIWYYMNGSGAMLTGWQRIGGIWYYMNGSGAMLTGWQRVGGRWYYMNGSGAMLTGWQRVGGKWYYMNGSGVMQTGWQRVGGKWYYMNGSGVMQTGWQRISGRWYYFNGGGILQNN